MSIITLSEILHKHKLWLNSDKDGQRAVFKDMDLSGVNLKGEDLRDADFVQIEEAAEAPVEETELPDADIPF